MPNKYHLRLYKSIIFLILKLQQPYFQRQSMSYYFRDQLSIKTNKILANLFAQLILLSQKVESFRQLLSSVPYFDSVQLFRVLDRGQKGFLRLADFLHLIGSTHKKLVTYAFSWFDQTKLGQVSRLQFISFLMPRRNEQLRQITARRIQQPVGDGMFSTTINQQLNIFTEMVNQMISHQLKIIQQRRLLLKQEDYSLKGVLHSLDSNVHDFVTTTDILKFLQNYAIQTTNEQIQDLLQIVDSRLTGKIKIEQLKWIIEGLQGEQKEYLNKIKSSMKGKTSRRKTYQEQYSHTTEKSFVRTPLKSKQNNTDKKQLQKSRNNYQSVAKSSNVKSDLRQSHYEKSRIKEQAKSFVKQNQPQVKKVDNFISNASSKFDEILQRYKRAETQALERDTELIKAEHQIKNKLRDEFEQKSNQRRRIMTQTKPMTAQRPYRDQSLIYLPQRRFLQYDFPETRSRSRIRDMPHHEYAMDLQYQHPYPSKYDSKINTIVENFYRRNHPAPYSDSNRKYGTLSGTFNYDRQRSQSSAYNLSMNDRISSYPSKFLQDSIMGVDRMKPFHQNSTLKKEINKKLGDDIFNIDLSHRKYDPSFHYARQKPLQDNIKRLKDAVKEKQQNKNQLKTASPKMLQNISIISKDTPSNQISAKPSPKINQDFKSKTQKKVRFAETPSSGYQSVSKAQPIQSKGFNTTQTRYPATDLKTIGSPLNYPKRQL